MKIQTANKGFSAVELIIVVAVLSILAGLLLPALTKSRSHNRRSFCINNLKQSGIGFRLWAYDNGGKYPAYKETNLTWNYFQTVGREIGNPKVLVCPEDISGRKPALDFQNSPQHSFSAQTFQNKGLSYFYGVDSLDEKSTMFLAGDRSLSTNATILSGMLSITPNTTVQWAKGMHKQTGNIGMADGSVFQLNDTRLIDLVRTGTNGTQRLIIP